MSERKYFGIDGTLFPKFIVHQGLLELAHPELTLFYGAKAQRTGKPATQPVSRGAEIRS